jgi:predicted nuclease of predicted toxin-antitoxin system
VKLLLDAIYSPEIAIRLRNRGHDVASITERPDLQGASDVELFAAMAAEDRTFVTNNVVDYLPLFRSALADGTERPGLFLTSDRSTPRNKAGIGRFLNVLEDLLTERPRDVTMPSQQ